MAAGGRSWGARLKLMASLIGAHVCQSDEVPPTSDHIHSPAPPTPPPPARPPRSGWTLGTSDSSYCAARRGGWAGLIWHLCLEHVTLFNSFGWFEYKYFCDFVGIFQFNTNITIIMSSSCRVFHIVLCRRRRRVVLKKKKLVNISSWFQQNRHKHAAVITLKTFAEMSFG